MTLVLARILARYLSGALVSYGILPHDVAAEMAVDPDVALILGAAIGVTTELAYAFAKRMGWAT